MKTWSNWGTTKPISLDRLGGVPGVGGKTGHGTDVANWWTSGDFDLITSYCRDDVRLTYRAFCRLMFTPIPERFLLATEDAGPVQNQIPDRPTTNNLIIFPSRPQ
jgi:hypothetical protein